MNNISVLAAPAHYVLSDAVGSEPYVAYKILEYLPKIYSVKFVAIVGYSVVKHPLPLNVKIFHLYTGQPKFSNLRLRKLKFYIDIYKISIKILNEWQPDIFHHILPFGYEETFNFLSLYNKFKDKPFIIGPVQNPHIFIGKDEDIRIKFTNNHHFLISEKLSDLVNNVSKPILKRLFIKTINQATKIIAVNNFTKNLYSKYVSKEKIVVIPFGIDISEFEYKKNYSKGELEILFAGMLTKRKGVEYLIRAYKLVSKEVPDSILRICGRGPQMDYLKKLCKKLDIEKRVIFEDFIPRNKLIEFYKNADVFVLPSLSESFGMALLEAMASGTPCIASNIVGPNEIIEHGATGFLFPKGDINKLSEYIILLLTDEKLKINMGKKAKNRVEEKYDWKIITKQYYRVYEEVL